MGTSPRTAHILRETKETKVEVTLDLDGAGRSTARTGIGMFDHLVEHVHGAAARLHEVLGEHLEPVHRRPLAQDVAEMDGAQADATYFNSTSNHAIAWRIDGSEFGDTASAIYVAYNGWSGQVNFTLPWPGNGKQWYRVTDTATWNEGANTFVTPGSEAVIGGENTVYGLQGRSLLLLIAK